MPKLILEILLQAAVLYPQLKKDIERIATGAGVPANEWREKLSKLEKHSADYFGSAGSGNVTEPIPHAFTYGAWLQSNPSDAELSNGDHVYGDKKDSPTQWFVWPGGPLAIGFPGMPRVENLIRVVAK